MVPKNSNSQRPNVEKDVRFAVVMYGGGSLAIYMNGVAQELFKMVRATARKRKRDGSFGNYVINRVQGTESVYRDLGEKLGARFVVDILSGTSAGGINAIYLAKALANRQDMKPLESLWIEFGNIGRLINDRMSIWKRKGPRFRPPPRSLLNSDLMYYILLDAFEKMDQETEKNENSLDPFTEELDLYVTATDLRGIPLPIPLADPQIKEYRYRTVFRLRYSAEGVAGRPFQDFENKDNPFLAFAARATSAFPVAFRPIKKSDIRPVFETRSFKHDPDKFAEITGNWSKFFTDYNLDTESFELHSFADGGYLDNKPFSYITETLLRRRSDIPVDRRLFYVEPSPERVKTNPSKYDRPDQLESLLAGVSLSRAETIREDLIKIRERNDLIERTNYILRQIEKSRGAIGEWHKERVKVAWRSQYLDQMLGPESVYGSGYAAYHQLRVSDTLDNLAAAVASNIGLVEESRSFYTLRKIFEEWRKRKYSSNSGDGLPSENELIFRLDVNWRKRRLFFMMRTIDDLLLGLGGFRADIETTDPTGKTDEKTEISSQEQDQQMHAQEIVQNCVKDKTLKWSIPDQETENRYFEILSQKKRYFNKAYAILRAGERQLRTRDLALMPADSEELKRDRELMKYVRSLQPFVGITGRLETILEDENELGKVCADIEELAQALASKPETENREAKSYLRTTFHDVSERAKMAFPIRDGGNTVISASEPSLEIPEYNIEACLQFYYDNFEFYDKLTFPITYATPIGESDVVDVHRISPEDATGLFKETENKRKLAGTKFFNFSSFFKEEWRRNDILWGQLDATERIIKTLEPDREKHKEFLVRAWLAILKDKKDTIGSENLQKLEKRFEKLITGPNRSQNAWEIFNDTQNFDSGDLTELEKLLHEYFENDYTINLKLPIFTRLWLIARSVIVAVALILSLITKYLLVPEQSQIWPAFVGGLAIILLGLSMGLHSGQSFVIQQSLLWFGIVVVLIILGIKFLIDYYGSNDLVSSDQNDVSPNTAPESRKTSP